MKKNLLTDLLKNNAYPGRGIVLGMSEEGKPRIAYFIMGRSENSRNRVFVGTDEDTMMTQAYDPSKMKDPSLIIYAPYRHLPGKYIITNGDQTDTIWNALKGDGDFRTACMTRTFEPDGPNFTPRISGQITLNDGKASFEMSILKSLEGDDSVNVRSFFTFDTLPCGFGLFLHTYQGDGNPLPSFEGEPERVDVTGDLDAWTKCIWQSLNQDNKISLFTCEIDPEKDTAEKRIVNKYQ